MPNELAVPAPEQHAIVPERSAATFTMQDLILMSKAFADSGMFGIKNQAQALTLLLLAQADGIHPAKAMMEYHVINGKPSLSADAMLARHQRGGGRVQWVTRTDEKVTAIFTGPLGEVEITWDQARATKAQLWGKENFRKHPAQMLAARCVSEGVRATNPAAVQGIYTPEEVIEFAPADQPPATYALDRDRRPADAPNDPQPADPTTETVHCNGGVVKKRRPKEGVPQPDFILYQLVREDHSEVEATCWSIPAAEGWIGSTHPETYTGPLVVELIPREYRGATTYTIKHACVPGDIVAPSANEDELGPPLDADTLLPLSPGA